MCPNGRPKGHLPSMGTEAPSFVESLTHWLVSRQATDMDEASELEFSDGDAPGSHQGPGPNLFPAQGAVVPPLRTSATGTPMSGTLSGKLLWAGFNGRCNKNCDTCYSFWAGGALAASDLA